MPSPIARVPSAASACDASSLPHRPTSPPPMGASLPVAMDAIPNQACAERGIRVVRLLPAAHACVSTHCSSLPRRHGCRPPLPLFLNPVLHVDPLLAFSCDQDDGRSLSVSSRISSPSTRGPLRRLLRLFHRRTAVVVHGGGAHRHVPGRRQRLDPGTGSGQMVNEAALTLHLFWNKSIAEMWRGCASLLSCTA